MTRGMLVTFIRSLTVGELVLSKGVTVSEAVTAFEYEGISLTSTPKPVVEMPRAGIGFRKRTNDAKQILATLCEQVADAIMQWPRLEAVLDGALERQNNDLRSCARPYGASFTASSTRVWVRFADRPKTEGGDGNSFVARLVCGAPRWFCESVIALGIVHSRLSAADPDFLQARNEASFRRLVAELQADPLGTFFSVRTDVCKSACDRRLRKEVEKGEKFLHEIRHAILSFSQDGDHDSLPSLEVQYARAIVTFVENAMMRAPVCARVFSAACADDSGSTPERAALKKALKVRGVTLIRWSDERDTSVRPLAFPPGWKDATQHSGPSVLLSFDSVM
jgi:hypothetical protein